MTVTEVLRILGGVAARSTLVGATSRGEFDQAVRDGSIIRVARGRYALPAAHEGLVVAARATGVVCLTSAALSFGWAVKTVPDTPHIAVPKHRRLSDELREQLVPHWIDLTPDETEGAATSAEKTLGMCGRWLPFDEALAIADSALRAGLPRAQLLHLAAEARGPGSARLRKVAEHADARAANPFESVLRATCLDVPGLSVEPQVVISGHRLGLSARPDLVDVRLRAALEADSFEWHGGRAALRSDARRYDLLVVNGWTVLRFSWEDVMLDPDWVREVLTAFVAERTECRRSHASPA
jgi:very-short-patch-repair endonuclease